MIPKTELTLLKGDVLRARDTIPNQRTKLTGIQCRGNRQRTPDSIRDNGRCFSRDICHAQGTKSEGVGVGKRAWVVAGDGLRSGQVLDGSE